MLEFADVPYRFYPSAPNRLVQAATRFVNRHIALPGPVHQISGLHLRGHSAILDQSRESNARFLFLPNHSTHSDPEILLEATRRVDRPCVFMAAYDVYLRSPVHAWLLQKSGSFSVDRDASDRKALNQATEILKTPGSSLTIFPEGNSWLSNDRIHPFLAGAALTGLRAAKSDAETADPLWFVPTSVKTTFERDESAVLRDRALALAKEAGLAVDRGLEPLELVRQIGIALLGRHLPKELSRQFESGIGTSEERAREIAFRLLGDVASEAAVSFRADESEFISRFSRLRSTIHSVLAADEGVHSDRRQAEEWSRKVLLAARIYSYTDGYLAESPTVDRLGERVLNLIEDHGSFSPRSLGPRHAIVRFGAPIHAAEFGAEHGFRGDAARLLTASVEKAVQAGIDEINQANPWPGGRRAEW